VLLLLLVLLGLGLGWRSGPVALMSDMRLRWMSLPDMSGLVRIDSMNCLA
jgi:hypothetical protein